MSQPDTPVQFQPHKHEEPNSSAPKHVYRKTREEDLRILAYAQYQFQTHLSPTQHINPTWQPTQEPTRQSRSQSRPHSIYGVSSSALRVEPDRCTTPTHLLPLQRWKNSNDSGSSSYKATGEPVNHPLEYDSTLGIEEDSIVESIEIDASISPGTEGNAMKQFSELNTKDEEAHLWNEAQQTWNGYVRHKESWVRRAGLKREREERDAHQGLSKKRRGS